MKFPKSLRIALLTLVLCLTSGLSALHAQLRVVTTLPDLASITRHVGGEHVDVFSIAAGYQNPHFVDPKPSFIVRLSRADMFVQVGLDLEIGWAPSLLESSRNSSIQRGSAGYLDASEGIELKQVPDQVSREEGDIHIYGNPHYWLDPIRGKQVADNIYNTLVELDPDNQEAYARNLEAFKQRIDEKMEEWQGMMEPYQGTEIIAYHNEWVYFEERFGLEIAGFLEPRPGIPPTPSQLVKVIEMVNSRDINVIINSPYFSNDSPEVVARNTDVQIVQLATMTGGYEEIEDYFDLFDYNVGQLVEAFESQE